MKAQVKQWRTLAAITLVLAGTPALAHHSFDAEYDANKTATTRVHKLATKIVAKNRPAGAV